MAKLFITQEQLHYGMQVQPIVDPVFVGGSAGRREYFLTQEDCDGNIHRLPDSNFSASAQAKLFMPVEQYSPRNVPPNMGFIAFVHGNRVLFCNGDVVYFSTDKDGRLWNEGKGRGTVGYKRVPAKLPKHAVLVPYADDKVVVVS